MKKYTPYFVTLILLCSSSGFGATAFWCDAKERDHSQIDDVPVFKALVVKKIQSSNNEGEEASLPFVQTPKGFLTIDSKDIAVTDNIKLIFQDAKGREYHVERWPNNSLRMYIIGNPVIMSGSKYLGISGQATNDSNDFILNCKSEM